MTCAHVVHVALTKVAGVEAVDVSLNKGLASVKLKPGNTVPVQQLWQLLHEKGYTPKDTAIVVKGDLETSQAGVRLKVSGTKDILTLAPDPKSPAAFKDIAKNAGRTVTVQGKMVPGKDLKAAVPLQVSQVQ